MRHYIVLSFDTLIAQLFMYYKVINRIPYLIYSTDMYKYWTVRTYIIENYIIIIVSVIHHYQSLLFIVALLYTRYIVCIGLYRVRAELRYIVCIGLYRVRAELSIKFSYTSWCLNKLYTQPINENQVQPTIIAWLQSPYMFTFRFIFLDFNQSLYWESYFNQI